MIAASGRLICIPRPDVCSDAWLEKKGSLNQEWPLILSEDHFFADLTFAHLALAAALILALTAALIFLRAFLTLVMGLALPALILAQRFF